MKLGSVLTAAGLVAVMAMAVVPVAKADSSPDPSVIVRQAAPGDPPCPPEDSTYTCFGATDGAGSVTEAFNPLGTENNYTWDGTGGGGAEDNELTSFTLDLTGVPLGETFQCFSDIWVECKFQPIAITGSTLTLAFVFDDLSPFTNPGQVPGQGGACQNNLPAGGTCPGFLLAGDEIAVIVDTPEPSAAWLLLLGLVPVFGFRKRLFGSLN
jgi:hypothetical protein